jgi:uncharacterized protein
MDREKKRRTVKIVAGIIFAIIAVQGLVTAFKSVSAPAPYVSSLPVEELVIETAAGEKRIFNVEIAAKPVDVQIGLMYRKQMPEDHGMLFEMGAPKEVSFWMKNTLIPLDLLFIAADGRIVNIHRNAVPGDLRSLPSLEPVTGVLEINGGMADKLGIKIGDRALHPYFSVSN